MSRIIRPAEINRDLKHIAKTIGRFRGPRFLAAAKAAFLRLADMPLLAGLLETANPRLAGVRVWPIPGFENYLIFYRPNKDGVTLMRVLHGARDYERLLGS